MSFLPDNYEVPQVGGGYFKPKEGKHKLRILGSPVLGYVRWEESSEGRKPVRSKSELSDGKHFWAMKIYNYQTESVEVWEVSQTGIQSKLEILANDSEWGSPVNYNITVIRTGTTMDDTKYEITPSPKSDLSVDVQEKVSQTIVNLDALFENKDPFDTSALPDFVTS